MTVLCDFDRSLIEQAYALAKARIPEPIGPVSCDLCEPGRRCLVHREPKDWPQPKATA